MPVTWSQPRIAKNPIQISSLQTARRVRLLDSRQDLSNFWVTPDSGSCVGPDGSKYYWDHAIRRELRARTGWLGMAINPLVHAGKDRASGEEKRWDLVLELKRGEKFKFSRLLCDWENDDGETMSAGEQEDLEVDHIVGGTAGRSPCDYRMSNLRPIDIPSHRQLQPPRGKSLKRPAAATFRRPVSHTAGSKRSKP